MLVLPTAYLPPVYYLARMLTADRVLIEQHDHYVKQTYRNRCTIAGPQGPLDLSVPIVHPASPDTPMRDIRLSDHGHWRHLHWNALESAYGQSPFFLYYADDLRPTLHGSFTFLIDLNEALLRLVCRLIGLPDRVERTRQYVPEGTMADDLRPTLHPKRAYWQHDPAFHAVAYHQVFQQRHGFLPNLSVVDLLFNMGPESLLVLRQCMGLPATASPIDAPSLPFVAPHPLFRPTPACPATPPSVTLSLTVAPSPTVAP